jgi:hypothetical protein
VKFAAIFLSLIAVWNSVQYLRRPEMCPDCKEPNYARKLNLGTAIVFAAASGIMTLVSS